MRIQFAIVGTMEQHSNVDVEMDDVPRVGETVTLPGVPGDASIVRTVVWFPLGDPDGDGETYSFVYVVVGPPRPQ